jgi:hypothetical protein
MGYQFEAALNYQITPEPASELVGVIGICKLTGIQIFVAE